MDGPCHADVARPRITVHVEKPTVLQAMRMTELNVKISKIVCPCIGSTEQIKIFKFIKNNKFQIAKNKPVVRFTTFLH